MIPGVLLLPLRVFADERGWFCEVRRETLLPHPTVQTNISFSHKGVIRASTTTSEARTTSSPA